MSFDGEQYEYPLENSSQAISVFDAMLEISQVENSAAQCRRQLYTREEWRATEALFYQFKDLSTYSKTFRKSISLSRVASDADDDAPKEEDKFLSFAAAIIEVGQKGDDNAMQEAHALINVVYGYRQIFSHMIKSFAAPGNDKLKRLLKDFLCLRSSEGELVSEAERISRDLAQARTRVQENNLQLVSSLSANISELSLSLRRVEDRYKRCESEFTRLEKVFNTEFVSILQSLAKIGSSKAQMSNLWNSFENIDDSGEIFGSHDIPNLTYKAEYEKLTSWYSDAVIAGVENLFVKNLKILADCNTRFQTILLLLYESLNTMERDIQSYG